VSAQHFDCTPASELARLGDVVDTCHQHVDFGRYRLRIPVLRPVIRPDLDPTVNARHGRVVEGKPYLVERKATRKAIVTTVYKAKKEPRQAVRGGRLRSQ